LIALSTACAVLIADACGDVIYICRRLQTVRRLAAQRLLVLAP